MVALQQMRHFVDHHIFQTRLRVLGQFQAQPDAFRPNITGAPTGFHGLHTPVGHIDTEKGFVVGDKAWDTGFERLAVPVLHESCPVCLGSVGTAMQVDIMGVLEFNASGLCRGMNPQSVTSAQVVVTFSRNIFSGRDAVLPLKMVLMFPDPGKPNQNRRPDIVLTEMQGCRHPNPAQWGIDAQMQVLDGFDDHLNR